MTEEGLSADRFEEHRGHLRAVAYRMLGSLAEADDAVQETWVKLSRVDADEIRNLGGWLTTVVGRVCLDMLRSRALRREEPIDETFVPDPVIRPLAYADPEHEVLQATADRRARRRTRPEPSEGRGRHRRRRPARPRAAPPGSLPVLRVRVP